MKGSAYLYLMVIGVTAALQGQGLGGKLLRALIEESEQVRLPVYTETQTEGNVRWYERLGFRLLDEITLPIIDLPQWAMLREPAR